jgi:hypothetical protein
MAKFKVRSTDGQQEDFDADALEITARGDESPLSPEKAVDVLLTLWQGAAARRQNRQAYEWKIAFGVWAGQIASLGFVLNRSKDLNLADWASVPYLAGGLVLVCLHFAFVKFIQTRNAEDLDAAIGYEQAVRTMLGPSDLPALPDLGRRSLWSWQTHGFEVGMTFFLALAGPLTLHKWPF